MGVEELGGLPEFRGQTLSVRCGETKRQYALGDWRRPKVVREAQAVLSEDRRAARFFEEPGNAAR